MELTTDCIRVAEVRRVKHPVFPEIEKHYMTVRAIHRTRWHLQGCECS